MPPSEVASPTKADLKGLKNNFLPPGVKDSNYRPPLILEQDSESVSSRSGTSESSQGKSSKKPSQKPSKKPQSKKESKSKKSLVSPSDKSHLFSKAFANQTSLDRRQNSKNSSTLNSALMKPPNMKINQNPSDPRYKPMASRLSVGTFTDSDSEEEKKSLPSPKKL